ncbi:hypothetical protein PUN28_015509 [Cardiocondyla obscurior]|uniref:Ribosomal protein L34 n=1 Tax=Cardiocondyla obscurior TaxID=286306 RepID=A0AAW2EZF5_9HYME
MRTRCIEEQLRRKRKEALTLLQVTRRFLGAGTFRVGVTRRRSRICVTKNHRRPDASRHRDRHR